MSSSANVRSVQALVALKAALGRFGGETSESLSSADQEIRQAQEWLAGRVQYWQNEVNRAQQALRAAEAALAHCKASGYRDKDGYYHEPSCTAEQAAVSRAKAYLAVAEAELRNAVQWTQRVNQAAAEYRQQAQRLVAMLNNDLAKATALLERKIGDLNAYLATGTPSSSTVQGGTLVNDVLMAAATMCGVTASKVAYAPLDASTSGHYDKETGVLELSDKYRNVNEPLLLSPILAHEAVHSRYKSDDPHDERSLKKYVDEEIEAYRAQLEAWQLVKEDFNRRYPPARRSKLLNEEERNLLSEHLQLESKIAGKNGWSKFRKEREVHYREIMRAK